MSRLDRFAPPFTFTRFFSPEDSLLCVLATEAVIQRRPPGGCVVELTSGSGLVGFSALAADPALRLVGVDVDPDALEVAADNAALLGMSARARFHTLSLWDEAVERLLGDFAPDILVCNPPYIPEPPETPLALEAGSGPDGARHLRQVIHLAEHSSAEWIALSWCSLSDPAGIVEEAGKAGYDLTDLSVAAIADGEYAGSVHDYVRSLPTSFLAEDERSIRAVAPDGAARFAYLLMAGAWHRRSAGARRMTSGSVRAMATLCERFAREGVQSLADLPVPWPTRAFVLDRWDEIAVRVALHGPRTGTVARAALGEGAQR